MNRSSAHEQLSRPVGLEHLSLYKVAVSDFVSAAAAGGADSVCLSVNHPGVLDQRARSALLAQMADANLAVSMGDGFLLNVGQGLDGLERQLDLLLELGGPYANACAFEPDGSKERDPGLIEDQLGDFARLANDAGVGVLIEFTPLSHVPSLAAAVTLLRRINEPNLKIMVDTLHLARAGEGPDDIAGVDAELFGYCQVSDGPLGTMDLDAYMAEAIYNRAIPGDGDLPLEHILALLPKHITVSAEVPLRELEERGISAKERVRRIIAGSRRVLERSETISTHM
ncbi:sugar phosphate isomerase/epimerase [Nocardia sp. XZ_19_231]|uniref:sugar phosphate isomerase/epimerase family protein n=1 Tax=Nocardia sp. XZ_19_231 TaxID=2769252 RepID=UPI00188EC77D|nr:sugar phosphate isomerase/epimerase [Nocardia sp. XZ_19_231]